MSGSGMPDAIRGRCLVAGRCDGAPLWLDEPLSFWGGFDHETGTITEARHPQHGATVTDRVLVLPGTKGSTAGPAALLEALALGSGPAGIILTRPDVVCAIAAVALASLGHPTIPVLLLDPDAAETLRAAPRCRVDGDTVRVLET